MTTNAETGAPALIVFGLDEQRRPRAGTFSAAQAEEAIRRAKDARLVCAPTDQPGLVQLAGELQPGDLSKPRTEIVPTVMRVVYERLLAASGITKAPGEKKASAKPGKPNEARIAPSRDDIAVGDLVLAKDPEPENGWYEAIILEQTSEHIFRLKFRDYPEEDEVIRNRNQLALLPTG